MSESPLSRAYRFAASAARLLRLSRKTATDATTAGPTGTESGMSRRSRAERTRTLEASATDWSCMPAVMAMLAEWDRRMEDRGIHDNCRCESLKLHMYVDGSGEITGTYTKVREDMSEEEHLIAMLHGEDHVLLEFDSLPELHGALVAQVMTVGGKR